MASGIHKQQKQDKNPLNFTNHLLLKDMISPQDLITGRSTNWEKKTPQIWKFCIETKSNLPGFVISDPRKSSAYLTSMNKTFPAKYSLLIVFGKTENGLELQIHHY